MRTPGAPAAKKLPITKDNTVCGAGEREIVEVNAKGGNLAGAVVYATKIDAGKPWGEMDKAGHDKKGCRFAPDVLVVRKESDLTIRNSDPVLLTSPNPKRSGDAATRAAGVGCVREFVRPKTAG